jgi:hypothetical protein
MMADELAPLVPRQEAFFAIKPVIHTVIHTVIHPVRRKTAARAAYPSVVGA